MTWSEPLYTAAEMRAAEATYAGPTLDLMERAGEGVTAAVLSRYPDARTVSIRCGTGANGGDGFVVARLLHASGRDVHTVLLGDETKVTGDAATNLRRVRELGLGPADRPEPSDLIVDALFGTGFSGEPRREAVAAFEEINLAGSPVVSVDVPSGIDASTGEVHSTAVHANLTVTFHGRKVGLAIAPGRFHAGEVELVDISVDQLETEIARATPAVLDLVPRRGPASNKYSAGSVLVVGGSTGYTGAPSLCSEAALRAGAGIVFLCLPEAVQPIVAPRLLEVMCRPYPDDGEGRLAPEAAGTIVELARRATAVAVGPGIGRSDGTRELVRLLLEQLELPLVLDADGLWAVAGHLDWVFARQAPTVLTPHAGELARLIGRESGRVSARRLDAARTGADETGAVLLLKGADTIVAAPGRGAIVADLGNPGLATAGSGDVLTGVVAALLAKGMEPQLATVAAAATQGVAARRAAESAGIAGMIASDVIPELSRALSW
jgi:ADP-dependent NAD(P)H-hydrate dehydratase / NAD(P)H-hydrate epimerase